MNIVWFKRDLRTHDHRALALASQNGPVLPLYIAEPEWWTQPDMSGRQWAFVAESLYELREALAELGQPLTIRTGDVIETLEGFREQFGAITLWSHEETGNDWTYSRDKAVAKWARAQGVDWHEVRQHGVIRRLSDRNGWAKAWDRFMAEPETLAPRALESIQGVQLGHIPSADDLNLNIDSCPERQTGGRRDGLKTLESFLFERGQPYRKAMSSPIAGAQHCSRLSPHLAWGTLSMREVAQSGWARQKQLKMDDVKGGWHGSMSSFQARLHWRDHFTQKLEDEPRLEFEPLHPAYIGMRPSIPDQARLNAWKTGETGLPFVDACMRSLIGTGWLNFRMRAMLMSVASYQLWLDWRAPGEHLARMFTDYEPGIHWPQVQMQSGTTGINTVRMYNPIKQGYDQDPDGAFVRHWVPELESIDPQFIHEPWQAPNASNVLDKTYPVAIVDHLEAAKSARQKIWAVRKGQDYRDEAKAIVTKHGSRKSGVSNPRARKARTASTNQLTLDFGLSGEDS